MFPLHEPLDDALRKELQEYDDLIAALLARRGVTSKEAADAFLNPSYETHLHNPLLMTDMARAAERLAHGILSGEKIAAWTDYDADGIPAAVLLHDFLEKAGANFEVYIPHRHTEGYGMNEHGVEQLASRGVTLIVTADSGITNLAPVARAKALGIDVIVTDHHLPQETLPDAFAVVNPNARADEPYPFKGLCGAGVAWKLVCATLFVSPELRAKIPEGWEKWLLDMVGIATVADMVPLTGENRVLATYGLLVLRKSPRIGLKKLCEAMRVNQRFISEDDIGFMLAPRINAASRMGDAVDAYKLFVAKEASEAERLAAKLETLNRKRKAEAGTITRAVHSRMKDRAIGKVIALGDPDWRPSLLGIVAGNLADEYNVPVFLWGREGNGGAKGSVRSGVVHALELMQAAQNTFAEFGGHAASGGFTVREDAVFDLEARLEAALASLAPKTEDPLEMRADAVLEPHEATPEFLKRLSRLAPFGQENEKPVFLFRSVPVVRVSRFGKAQEHLKLALLKDESGTTMDAVTFFAKGMLAKTADALAPHARAHLIAHLERDTFTRGAPVRLRLLDLKLV